MDIEPDTKDWTWVLERPCPECGLDAGAVDPRDVAGMVRSVAADWAALLRAGGPGVRARPEPGVWSALEYGCHVRDVFRIYDRRLQLMRTQDDPLFPNWDQDATAVAERYGEQDPAAVAAELAAAGAAVADRFDEVEDWQRPGRRSDGPTSRSPRSPATSSTTRSTTSTTPPGPADPARFHDVTPAGRRIRGQRR